MWKLFLGLGLGLAGGYYLSRKVTAPQSDPWGAVKAKLLDSAGEVYCRGRGFQPK